MKALNWSLKCVLAKIAKYFIGFVNPNSMLLNQFINYVINLAAKELLNA